ncbi:hypothetical protein ACWY4P_47965 [Streptomyces sp. LZ34]
MAFRSAWLNSSDRAFPAALPHRLPLPALHRLADALSREPRFGVEPRIIADHEVLPAHPHPAGSPTSRSADSRTGFLAMPMDCGIGPRQ